MSKYRPRFDHSGSSFDNFLEDEGIREEADATALDRLVHHMLEGITDKRWRQDELRECQRIVCLHYSAHFVPIDGDSKMGIAMATQGLVPLNGLRHPLTRETSGWYIWWGEKFSTATDFFAPTHAYHFFDDYPEPAAILGLPPGFRFIWTKKYLDVWRDPTLLNNIEGPDK